MRRAVALAAGGAEWEADSLAAIDSEPDLFLARRCLDVADLRSAAAAGSVDIAVCGLALSGLDADTVAYLRRLGTKVVLVAEEAEEVRAARLGGDRVATASGVVALLAESGSLFAGQSSPEASPPDTPAGDVGAPVAGGRVIAVWGAQGAPGRTSVAVGVAAELAASGTGVVLLDADPYGGAVAQHLGILDQVSGLLAAARLANAGRLDLAALAGIARQVGERLRVVTGLPRGDRYLEVRPPAYDTLVEVAACLEPVLVIDTGFSLERSGDPLIPIERNQLTIAALERADVVVVVGGADAVGLARLVRGLHDLADLVPGVRPVVVVNRMRSSLGWTQRDVEAVIGQVVHADVVFLPDDRATADRALAGGRAVTELGDSALRKGLRDLAQALRSRYSPATV